MPLPKIKCSNIWYILIGNWFIRIQSKFSIQITFENPGWFNLYDMAEPSSNKIGGKGVQAETKNEEFTVMCSRSPHNLEFGHFTLLFARVQRKNVPNL